MTETDNKHEERTENPTYYRLKKVRKRGGQYKNFRDLNSILILLIALFEIRFNVQSIFFKFEAMIKRYFNFDNITHISDNKKIVFLSYNFLKVILIGYVFLFINILIIAISVSYVLNGCCLRINFLKLDFKKINLLKGIKNIFSFKTILEFLKITIKLFFLIYFSILFLHSVISNLLNLFLTQNTTTYFFQGIHILYKCCVVTILIIFPFVFFDLLLEYYQYNKNLKMTRQEIRDEFKQIEGNPLIKSRIRQVMRFIAKKRMMSELSKANVIIINPIHYAVALKYDEKIMHAPKVLAKGAGVVALNICQLAKKYQIPILESPVLTRILYRYVEIGSYIPSKFYKSVAEVLAWVWRLKKWKKNGGEYPIKPTNFSIHNHHD